MRRRGQENLYDKPPHFGNTSDDEDNGRHRREQEYPNPPHRTTGRQERPVYNTVGPTTGRPVGVGAGLLEQDYAC
jgi:hypothetical protein